MGDFEPGDFVTYQNGRFIGRIVECDNFNYIRSCDVKLTEHTPAMESNSIPVGYTMRRLEKKFLSHSQKPLRNVLKRKGRQSAIRNSLERATGQYAGPASWANTVRKYSGNSFPRGAEGPWSNGRRGNWVRMKGPLIASEKRWNWVQNAGRSRRRRTKRGRKTRRN